MTQSAGAAPRPRPSLGGMLPVAIVAAIVGAFIILGPSVAWTTLLMNPIINSLLLLTNLVGGQFGIAIILFTLILRIVTIPFTLRQLQSTRAMQDVQPRMKEIQKKYKDPKRRQEETMKLYRESGVNPLGCFFPMAIQMLIFIALWRALASVVGGSPEGLVGLSERIYPWSYLSDAIPLELSFLWLQLGEADPIVIFPSLVTPLSLLVGISTYVQTRLSATPAAAPQQQQQQQMMTWMMPLMMMFITVSLPSGVGVYWVTSNLFQVAVSVPVYGRRLTWRTLLPTSAAVEPEKPPPKIQKDEEEEAEEAEAVTPSPPVAREARSRHGKRRGKRKRRR